MLILLRWNGSNKINAFVCYTFRKKEVKQPNKRYRDEEKELKQRSSKDSGKIVEFWEISKASFVPRRASYKVDVKVKQTEAVVFL